MSEHRFESVEAAQRPPRRGGHWPGRAARARGGEGNAGPNCCECEVPLRNPPAWKGTGEPRAAARTQVRRRGAQGSAFSAGSGGKRDVVDGAHGRSWFALRVDAKEPTRSQRCEGRVRADEAEPHANARAEGHGLLFTAARTDGGNRGRAARGRAPAIRPQQPGGRVAVFAGMAHARRRTRHRDAHEVREAEDQHDHVRAPGHVRSGASVSNLLQDPASCTQPASRPRRDAVVRPRLQLLDRRLVDGRRVPHELIPEQLRR